MTPTENEGFVFSDQLQIALKFAPAVPEYPPAGGVLVQWGFEGPGGCTYSLGELSVPHYTMTQMMGKTQFPQVGRYCLRAMSVVDKWSQPRRIYVFTPELGIVGDKGKQQFKSQDAAGESDARRALPAPPRVNPPAKGGAPTMPKAGSP